MNPTIAEGTRRLRSAGLLPPGDTGGCTSEEITRIESKVGQRLPGVYRDFLAVVGRSSGGFMRGSDLACDQLLRINREARDLTREGGLSLSSSAFVFLMHQGYQFLCFDLGAGADPEVSRFEEGGAIQRLGVSFSSWFLGAVDDEIRIVRGLGR
jgi:hypothetical protein